MKGYIRYLPNPLLDDIVEGRCIPIIGAGFSRNADLPSKFQMPLWNDIGEILAKKMKNYPYSTPIDSVSAFSYEFSRAKLIEQLRDILHVEVVKPGIVHLAFANLPFDKVITTNFDFLLERSYDIKGRPYIPIIDEDQLSTSSIPRWTCILKIHGDLNHPSRLIITEDDYDTFLEKYPLLCTFTSNLLISRTPLFIGYSLEDPDFRQIWQIIGVRLGKLRRNAYVLTVGASSNDIAKYERRGTKTISLPGKESDYGNILSSLFQELNDYWMDKISEVSSVANEESLVELALPRDAQSRLCFFAIPFDLISFYRNNIFPIFERYGFAPIIASDVVSPGDNLIAKISSLMERSTLMIADISGSQSVMLELGTALSKNLRTIIIKKEDVEIPLDMRSFEYIMRPNIEEPRNLGLSDVSEFLYNLEKHIKAISKKLVSQLSKEPIRLLEKGEYRASVISAITLLETELKGKLFKDKDVEIPSSLLKLLDLAIKQEYLPADKLASVRQWIAIRNQLVHTKESISKREASQIVQGVISISKLIHERERNS